MAAKEEKAANQLFEEMKSLAVEQQQCFYELLPDYTIYISDNDPEKNQHKYLKQNIGYAMFGPPMVNEEEMNNTENSKQFCYGKTENPNNIEADIADAVDYEKNAQKAIDNIYMKICNYINMEADPLQSIHVGIIYNVIVYYNTNVESKKKEVEETAEKKTEAEVKEEKVLVVPIPIFKVRKCIQKTVDDANKPSTSIKDEEDLFETWYIDGNRTYKSWSDYIENNNLPECTMVLPKDGFYQPNPDYPIEKDYSTVWVEIMDSPACALTTKVYSNVDRISNIIGIGVLGLSAAALVTPLAPVAALASVPVASATIASGIWTMFRNSQELINRYNHDESINPLDLEAFPYWLGLTGSATCLGALGGSVLISKAAANGATIPTVTKIAFNTVQGSHLLLNGISVAYMSYNMIEKYNEEQTFNYLDALNLATHFMFFASSVINVKFANEIIQDSQGRVIDEYKKTRRSKNLRRKFNRAARKAAENNTCKISENAEVIRFIRNRQDFLSFDQSNTSSQTSFDKTSPKWSYDQGKIKIGNIILLDPVEYVLRLISSDLFLIPDQNNSSDSQDNSNNIIFNQLKEFLHGLLTELYTYFDCPENIPTLSEFDQLLEDLSSMHINNDCLKLLFNIAVMLMKYCNANDKNRKYCLFMCFTFIWQYCKANLKQWGIQTRHRMQSESGSNILRKIVIIVSEAASMMFDNLAAAAFMYVEANLYKH